MRTRLGDRLADLIDEPGRVRRPSSRTGLAALADAVVRGRAGARRARARVPCSVSAGRLLHAVEPQLRRALRETSPSRRAAARQPARRSLPTARCGCLPCPACGGRLPDEPERSWQLMRRLGHAADGLDRAWTPRRGLRPGRPRGALPLGRAGAARLLRARPWNGGLWARRSRACRTRVPVRERASVRAAAGLGAHRLSSSATPTTMCPEVPVVGAPGVDPGRSRQVGALLAGAGESRASRRRAIARGSSGTRCRTCRTARGRAHPLDRRTGIRAAPGAPSTSDARHRAPSSTSTALAAPRPSRARVIATHGAAHDRPHRRAHPSGPHRGRAASAVPRLRHERHRQPGAAGRARRPQAGPPPDPVHDERDGPHRRPRLSQVRGDRGRGDGQVPPPRRPGAVRRAGAAGPGLLAALPARGRAGQLRLGGRRPARRHALHRGAHDRHRARSCWRTSTRTPSTSSRTTTAPGCSPRCSPRSCPTCSSTARPASRWAWPPTSRPTTWARSPRATQRAHRRPGADRPTSCREYHPRPRLPDRRHHLPLRRAAQPVHRAVGAGGRHPRHVRPRPRAGS